MTCSDEPNAASKRHTEQRVQAYRRATDDEARSDKPGSADDETSCVSERHAEECVHTYQRVARMTRRAPHASNTTSNVSLLTAEQRRRRIEQRQAEHCRR